MTHRAIRDGLVETNIPQVNIDQLNNRRSLMLMDVITQEQFDTWFTNLPHFFTTLSMMGGTNFTTKCHKLMCCILLQQDDWSDWEKFENLQLDQYEKQFMFGAPCKSIKKSTVFNLIWTYLIKKDTGVK